MPISVYVIEEKDNDTWVFHRKRCKWYQKDKIIEEKASYTTNAAFNCLRGLGYSSASACQLCCPELVDFYYYPLTPPAPMMFKIEAWIGKQKKRRYKACHRNYEKSKSAR